MSTMTIEERREQALAELPPYREPGLATRGFRWLRQHVVQFFAAFALLFMFIPVFIVVLFSFNNPTGKYNYVWNEFSTSAWVNVWSDAGDHRLTDDQHRDRARQHPCRDRAGNADCVRDRSAQLPRPWRDQPLDLHADGHT